MRRSKILQISKKYYNFHINLHLCLFQQPSNNNNQPWFRPSQSFSGSSYYPDYNSYYPDSYYPNYNYGNNHYHQSDYYGYDQGGWSGSYGSNYGNGNCSISFLIKLSFIKSLNSLIKHIPWKWLYIIFRQCRLWMERPTTREAGSLSSCKSWGSLAKHWVGEEVEGSFRWLNSDYRIKVRRLDEYS